MVQTMRATRFELEPLGEVAFDGYTMGEYWNGFDCPYFTFDQALLVTEACKATGWGAWYDAGQRSFKFVSPDNAGSADETVEYFEEVELDGRKLFPIGAFSWIWSEVGRY